MDTRDGRARSPADIVNRLPEASPYGSGPIFRVVNPNDVFTFHADISVPAGQYEAQRSADIMSSITLWSPGHHSGATWVTLPWRLFAYPDAVTDVAPCPEPADGRAL